MAETKSVIPSELLQKTVPIDVLKELCERANGKSQITLGEVDMALRHGLEESSMSQAAMELFRLRIMKALEQPGFVWRSVDGIARETGDSPEAIRAVLRLLLEEGIAVQAGTPDSKGRTLYTTREHYNKSRGNVHRFLDIVAGHIR